MRGQIELGAQSFSDRTVFLAFPLSVSRHDFATFSFSLSVSTGHMFGERAEEKRSKRLIKIILNRNFLKECKMFLDRVCRMGKRHRL